MLVGKNFKQVNEFGIVYKLINEQLSNKMEMYVFDQFDLEVDWKKDKEEFWFVMKDLDDQYFAQPLGAKNLAQKLMSGPWRAERVKQEQHSNA